VRDMGHMFKVLVVGNAGVGKTSIIKRYAHGIFRCVTTHTCSGERGEHGSVGSMHTVVRSEKMPCGV
jgi:putative ribosome biogenesis GTPase RsgA